MLSVAALSNRKTVCTVLRAALGRRLPQNFEILCNQMKRLAKCFARCRIPIIIEKMPNPCLFGVFFGTKRSSVQITSPRLMYFVYVLRSRTTGRRYVGACEDLSN